jgi:hypothetical protein
MIVSDSNNGSARQRNYAEQAARLRSLAHETIDLNSRTFYTQLAATYERLSGLSACEPVALETAQL